MWSYITEKWNSLWVVGPCPNTKPSHVITTGPNQVSPTSDQNQNAKTYRDNIQWQRETPLQSYYRNGSTFPPKR